METPSEKTQILHDAGWVLKDDTLKDFRESILLTPAAMAGEMGLTERRYLSLESGKTKTKHFHLKSALNVVNLFRLHAGLLKMNHPKSWPIEQLRFNSKEWG